MSESAASTVGTGSTEAQVSPEFVLDREQDRARLRRVAGVHFVLVMGALTLWGAADAWAASTGWALARATALANAVIAGVIIANTLHEWGHYAGARLSGAAAPVLKNAPVRYFFIFDFKFAHNDLRQFQWMSLGGIAVPWLLVAAVALLVPIDNASRALLLATFVARAVAVVVFEGPVVWHAHGGTDPQEALGQRLRAGALTTSRYAGLAAGAILWLGVS